MTGKWIRVSHAEPCPICERDSWCTVSADGQAVHCMRAESAKTVKSGGWVHKLEGAKVVALPQRREVEEKRPLIRWDDEAARMYAAERATGTRAALAQDLGVKVESLELLSVGWGADKQEFASFPMRGLRQTVIGIVRRYQDGSKKTMRWGKVGLFHPVDWLQFGGPVLIPEGASDVAALLSMNLCGVGRPSNLGGVKELVALLVNEKAKRRTVIVLCERDEKLDRRGTRPWCPPGCAGCNYCWPGLWGGAQTAAELKAALGKNVAFRFPPDGAKDVRAWVKIHGLDGRRFLSGLKSR